MKQQHSPPFFLTRFSRAVWAGLIVLCWMGPGLNFAQAGEPDGLKIEYWDNGQIKLEECWQSGKKEGLFYHWYENGNPRSRELFVSDTLNGVARYWYENGHKKERTKYKRGRKHGFSILYAPSGKRLMTLRYKNGKVVGNKSRQTGVIKPPEGLDLKEMK